MSTQDGTGEQASTTGASSDTVFLPTLLFSSSHFYYLFCRKLQQQTRRGQVGRDRMGRRGDSNAGRGAGGREEEVGEGRKAGWRGNMGTAEAEGQVTKGCEWEL